jgi:hypothetical protein
LRYSEKKILSQKDVNGGDSPKNLNGTMGVIAIFFLNLLCFTVEKFAYVYIVTNPETTILCAAMAQGICQ